MKTGAELNSYMCVELWNADEKLWNTDIDGLVQDCSNSTANALELLQSCNKPSICICILSFLNIEMFQAGDIPYQWGYN